MMKIKQHQLDMPVIQGGMGIGVSLGNLAGAIAKAGGVGVVSAAQPGFKHPDFKKNPLKYNLEALHHEITKAKMLAKGKGMIAANVMVAGYNYAELVKASVSAGVDAIISGAGIPLDLPKYVEEPNVLIAPIVSSAKALQLVLKAWKKRYDREPDFIVCEGALAGGHLGFSAESIENQSAQSLEAILQDVLALLKEQHLSNIPVFVGGGIYSGYDIAHFVKLGASGVQMGTRFITTHECDADDAFKQAFLKEAKNKIDLVVSPAKLPGRAFMTDFMQRVKTYGSQPVQHCYRCLQKCNPANTPYCISEALMQAAKGNIQEGLVFTGSNGGRAEKIMSVEEVMKELKREYQYSMGEVL